MIERELNGRKLRIYDNGKIESFNRNAWRELSSKPKKNGYIRFTINKKYYLASRIIVWAFRDFDINNPNIFIDHINHNTTDNRLCNLRIVTPLQNQWNRNHKGYTKLGKKWRVRIAVNNKRICLGCYATEDEARQAYLEAKEKYHVI